MNSRCSSYKCTITFFRGREVIENIESNFDARNDNKIMLLRIDGLRLHKIRGFLHSD